MPRLGRNTVQHYAPGGFVLPLALIRLALAEAEHAEVPMSSAHLVRDRLIAEITRGHGDLD
jgi:hypothetical protein